MSRIAKDRTPVLLAAMPVLSTREDCSVIPEQFCIFTPASESGTENLKTAAHPSPYANCDSWQKSKFRG
jgi:hypothetical protein